MNCRNESLEQRKRVTIRLERWRSISAGIIETAVSTFLLLIAVRWFRAEPLSKALIASGSSLGMLFSPLIVAVVQYAAWRNTAVAAAANIVSGVLFLAAAFGQNLSLLVVASLIGIGAAAATVPLFKQMYQDNFPEGERGSLFAQTSMVRIVTASGFGFAVGYLLSGRLNLFPFLLIVFAGAFFFAASCVSRCPASVLESSGRFQLFSGFRYIPSDRLFRQTLICWFLMGFGNLMMAPLRVEYLANPRYHLALSELQVSIFVSVVPSITRFILAPLWGRLFDRVNFFWLRIVVNLAFLVGIITFFQSDTLLGLTLGAIAYGVAFSGADVAWSLWVTKFAQPERVAEYMSVHTFFTGVRGVLAPLASFQLANRYPIHWLGYGSTLLILISVAMLIPEARRLRSSPGEVLEV